MQLPPSYCLPYKLARRNNLPPGPKGLPLVGNIASDLPSSWPWVKFAEMGKKYGGMTYLPRCSRDLLNRQNKLSSNRPVLTMGGKLVGWDQGPALIQFGDTWSQHRRLLSQFMGHPSNKKQTYWTHHTRYYAGSIVLTVTYGYSTKGRDDKLVKLVDNAMEQFSETTAANAFMVDIFPILRFVPEWFPGAAWKKNTSQSCFVSDLLHETTKSREEMAVIEWAAAGIYSGGADTPLFFALTVHQDEQVKAQAEIDTVLGQGSLPTLADRPFAEAMRVYTLGPIGLPHVTTEPIVHEGYFIPKGIIVLTNNWQFFRDPDTYPEPEVLRPERFMGAKKERDPRDFSFGYGRDSSQL
ncbi:cytochrome P450 [Mycena floridula]|nr:cytochrome P450 [Mycena floridula]